MEGEEDEGLAAAGAGHGRSSGGTRGARAAPATAESRSGMALARVDQGKSRPSSLFFLATPLHTVVVISNSKEFRFYWKEAWS